MNIEEIRDHAVSMQKDAQTVGSINAVRRMANDAAVLLRELCDNLLDIKRKVETLAKENENG